MIGDCSGVAGPTHRFKPSFTVIGYGCKTCNPCLYPKRCVGNVPQGSRTAMPACLGGCFRPSQTKPTCPPAAYPNTRGLRMLGGLPFEIVSISRKLVSFTSSSVLTAFVDAGSSNPCELWRLCSQLRHNTETSPRDGPQLTLSERGFVVLRLLPGRFVLSPDHHMERPPSLPPPPRQDRLLGMNLLRSSLLPVAHREATRVLQSTHPRSERATPSS